jgi:transcriptional regulator with XRE-family HTH domain
MDVSTEIGALLRHWRERLTPAQIGLPAATGRRVPGLRRVEVAKLAGVSTDYLVQLEQGRGGAASPEVLYALARALRLSPIESDHLLQLAGYRPTTAAPVAPPAHARRLIDQLHAQPAAIYDRSWNPVTWNPLWAGIHGDPNERHGRDRNMVWRLFAASATRVQRTDGSLDDVQRTLVGDLRARHGRHPGDPTLGRLIEELRTQHPRFHAMWEHGEVHAYRHEVKAFTHPTIGRLTLDCDIVALDGQQQYQAIIYTAAPHSGSASQLRRLRTSPDTATAAAETA